MAGADFIESIAKNGAEEIIERIRLGRQAMGPRPPFTRRVRTDEKLGRWLSYALAGQSGWRRFLDEREAEGMPPQDAIVELVRFFHWGRRHLDRSGIGPPTADREL